MNILAWLFGAKKTTAPTKRTRRKVPKYKRALQKLVKATGRRKATGQAKASAHDILVMQNVKRAKAEIERKEGKKAVKNARFLENEDGSVQRVW